MKKLSVKLCGLVILVALFSVGMMVQDSVSNLVQCPVGGGICTAAQGATPESDFINGSNEVDDIGALAGNDIIFGNGGDDTLSAGDGDDFISGGLGNDIYGGGNGNDILLVGPDDGTPLGSQNVSAGDGNDHIIVLIGQSTGFDPGTAIGCGDGQDVVTFFNGPFVFEQPNPPVPVTVFDPISGAEFTMTPACEVIQGLAFLPI